MSILIDTRNENYYIITTHDGNQFKISKKTNTEEDVIEWLKTNGATQITIKREDKNEQISFESESEKPL